MKYFSYFYVLLFVITFSSISYAQNFGGCGFNDSTNNEGPILKSIDCSNSSTTWNNQYRTPDYWVSDSTTPIKTILVNWIVCQDDNGENGWKDMPEFRDQVDLMFEKVNKIYSEVQPKGYSLPCEPTIDYITDTRIRFELNEIIFIQNDAFNLAGNGSSILNWLFANHPTTQFQLNHIFTMPPNPGGPSHWGMYSHYNGLPYVITHYSMFSDWYVVWDDHTNHVAHEYGHAVGLHHPYNAEAYLEITNYDFLDDLFGYCAVTSCCTPNSGYVCPLTSDCFWQTATPPLALMNGTNNQRYISPKQSGRMHRALSLFDNTFIVNNKNMHRYVKEITPSSIPLEVSQSEIWDFKIKMYQNIIVKSGSTLTIKCEVMMPNGGEIFVEQGARLIIDGGKITNYHYLDDTRKGFWGGIQVYGTTNQHQYPTLNPTYQGMLVVTNGGVIENANRGVTNWNEGNWHEIGGVIQVTDGVFRNNRKDVEFIAYQNFDPSNPSIKRDNTSFFKDTDFISDDDFIEKGLAILPHVTLWDVNGISFQNCHFANEVTDKENTSAPHRAIYSVDAGYSVLARCTTIQPIGVPCPTANLLRSSFKGFKNAIEATGAGTSETVTIQQAEFIDNVWDISIDEFDNVSINRNEIVTGNTTLSPIFPIGVGVNISNSTGFLVEENTISTSLTNGYSLGISVTDGGTDDNRLYKNNLEELTFGLYGNGINHNSNYQKGLQFLCNSLTNNQEAIRISSNVTTDGVRFYQGEYSPKKSAGNTFANNTMDISNLSNSIVYMHNGGNTEPLNYQGLITLEGSSSVNNCPSSFGGLILMGGDLALDSLGSRLDDLTTSYNDLNFVYTSLIDDGNTEEFKDNIELNWSSDAWLLRGKLLESSPYLSSEVLLEAAKQNVLPNGMLLEILLANPDATRSERFVEELKMVTQNSFPEYMLDYVRGNWDNRTLRTDMEGQLSSIHSELSNTRNWIKHLTKTKEEYKYEDRLNVVKLGDEIYSKVGLIDFYIENNEFNKADSVLNAIENDKKYKNDFSLIENFGEYINFRSSLDNRNLAQLDSTEIAYLQDLAEYNGRVAGYAQNILCFFYDICFEKELVFEEPKTKSNMVLNSKSEELNNILYNVNIYPNPAADYTSIQWEIFDELRDAHYRVLDLNGRELLTGALTSNKGEEIIDTRKLEQGVYIIGIYNNQKLMVNKKLVVEGRE